jgi:cytochrome c5
MKTGFSPRYLLATAVAVATLSVSAGAAAAEVDMNKYNASCGACHMAGVAGAPKTGDAAAWAPRLEKGIDALVASVKKGLNVMPAGGLCASCSDEDYKALITYMSTPQ